MNHQNLSNIKGINKEKALDYSRKFFRKLGVMANSRILRKIWNRCPKCKKCISKIRINAIDKIEENPYILIDVANNVDFKKIDKIALDIGTI